MRTYEDEAEFETEFDELDENEAGEASYAEYDEAEADDEFDEFEDEFDEFEYDEAEFDAEYDEELDELAEELAEELDDYLGELDELGGEYGSPLSEEEELALAEQLLELSDEDELGRLLAGVATRVAKRFGPAAIKNARGALSGLLRRAPGIAQRLAQRFRGGRGRPSAGATPSSKRRGGSTTQRQGARGGGGQRRPKNRRTKQRGRQRTAQQRRRQGAPGARGSALRQIGTDLATGIASSAIWDLISPFEQEVDGLDQKEAEFESARRLVQLSAAAGRNLAAARRGADPQVAARAALLAAFRRYAPQLSRYFPMFATPGAHGPSQRSRAGNGHRPAPRPGRLTPHGRPVRQPTTGRWVRRGNRIIVTGL